MIQQNISKLDDRIFLIDGLDMKIPHRTGTYVIDEAELTLIGTGPSPSIKYVKQGLQTLGFSLEQVKYIILTHADLDHAGGVGLLLRECPNAHVIVHPDGVEHLLNPRKVAAIRRAMYGDSFTEFFDPIVKVYEEDIIVKNEGDTLQIGPTCSLQFFHTPGYAKHHISVFDPISKGMFTGNAAGIRYDQIAHTTGVDLVVPATFPNQFDPQAMEHSIQCLLNLDVNRLYYGHYGMTETPNNALKQVAKWLQLFLEEGEQAFIEKRSYDELTVNLHNHVKNYVQKQSFIHDNHEVNLLIDLDLHLNALGLIDYFQRLKQ